MTILLVLMRAVHFSACLLIFGLYFFDRITASALTRPKISTYWHSRVRRISWVLLPLILVSGAGWFALVAMNMSGQPLDIDILKIVWMQTEFGRVWKIRLMFFVVVVVLSLSQGRSTGVRVFAAWVQTLATGCLTGSLAWAGHGQETSHWHLCADVLHLLGAGIWPAGLLPLILVLRIARKNAELEDWPSISLLVNRFSAISLATVSLLAVTGAVNAWYLVGSFRNLVEQPYGQWLLAKIVLLCAALAIAAVNLLRLMPRLLAARGHLKHAETTAAQLQRNVQFELILGFGIIAVVAVLGILPPAIQ